MCPENTKCRNACSTIKLDAVPLSIVRSLRLAIHAISIANSGMRAATKVYSATFSGKFRSIGRVPIRNYVQLVGV